MVSANSPLLTTKSAIWAVNLVTDQSWLAANSDELAQIHPCALKLDPLGLSVYHQELAKG